MPPKRVRCSLHQQQLIINHFNANGQNQCKTAAHFQVSRSCVQSILKREQQIENKIQQLSTVESRKRKSVQHGRLKEVDLHHWHVRVEIDAPEMNTTGEVLKAKALEFRDLILHSFGDDVSAQFKSQLRNFQASNGWLEKYTARYGTTSVRRCGEHSSTNSTNIQARAAYIRKALESFELADIWNADESALQHRTLSSRSYAIANNDKRGIKRSK